MRPALSPADLSVPIRRSKPFTAEGWLFELKHDGFRAFVRRRGSDVKLLSRSGRSMAASFPEIIVATQATLRDAVLQCAARLRLLPCYADVITA